MNTRSISPQPDASKINKKKKGEIKMFKTFDDYINDAKNFIKSVILCFGAISFMLSMLVLF